MEELLSGTIRFAVKYGIFLAKAIRKGPRPVNEAEIGRFITEAFELAVMKYKRLASRR